MRKTLLDILNDVKSGIDYEKEQHLVSEQILTSMEIVMLLMNLILQFHRLILYQRILSH